MKKTARCAGAVLAGLAALFLATVSAPAGEQPGFETYVVRQGDTLSTIAGRIFGDSSRWREIFKANPQVKNANRIYPGDSLLVPVPERQAAATGPQGGLAASAGSDTGQASGLEAGSGLADQGPAPGATAAPEAVAPTVDAGIPAVSPAPPPKPPVPVVSPALYRSAGFIADQLPTLAIIASEDGREMLASGDPAIVNASVAAGQRFTVVRADRRIFHPKTGEYLGWLIRVLGTAEVTCRGERTSTAVLQGMRDAAGVGDYLMPLDLNDVLEENTLSGKITPECIPPTACNGVIVAFEEDHMAAAELEFALIDLGTSAGVVPGRRFLIYREISPEGRVTVGELQVLRAGQRTSTALITTSIQALQVGDLLRAR